MNLQKKIITWKNHLETIAELGWQEEKTTEFIKQTIDEQSIIEGLGPNKTGAAFTLGKGPNKIFLRADIDALPVSDGVKHICGHSGHIAALLGAYHYLKEKEDTLTLKNKQVTFIFQPAEETFPSGAKAFVETYPELFEKCLYGFGVHNTPYLPIGVVELKDGIRSAAGDYLEIEVIGKSIHVESTPKGIDAIFGAALVIQEVQKFQKTFTNFGDSLVFNLDTIHGGTAPNIVAGKVKMTGDVRWFYEKDKERVKDFFEKLRKLIGQKFEGDIVIKYYDGYPPVKNDPKLTDIIRNKLKDDSNFSIGERKDKNLGIEDFCFYTEFAPCLFADIGVGGDSLPHQEEFIVSEEGTIALFEYWKVILDWWLH